MGKNKYYYKGVPLIRYAKQNDLSYDALKSYIGRKLKEDNTQNIDNLVEEAIKTVKKGRIKYYYEGIPLIRYAEENDLRYPAINAYINKKLKEDNTQNIDNLVEEAIKMVKKDNIKYYYKGIPLIAYAEQNNLSYNSLKAYINKKLKEDNTLDVEIIIEEAIKTIKKDNIKYYYKGVPLIRYAEQNNISYNSIKFYINRKLKEDNTLNVEKIIEEAIETIKKDGIKYYYKGIPLVKYATQNNLSYVSINSYINRELKKDNTQNIEELIDTAIKALSDCKPKNYYYFKGEKLSAFCQLNGYQYSSIYAKIKRLESKENLWNTEEIIEKAIKEYENQLQISKTKEIFIKLKNEKIDNIDEIKHICNYLKIDFENVRELLNMNFSYNQSINIIWFFSDKKLDNDYKIITYKKIKDILIFVDNLKKGNTDISNIDLYDLIGIYKSELYDSRNEILLRQKKHIYKVLHSICKNYGIKVNRNNIEDFESEIKCYLLIVVDKAVLNTAPQIFKYIDIVINGRFKGYLKQYIEQKKRLSLDENKFSRNKNTSRETPRIDYVTESNSLYKSQEKTLFGSDMMKVLSTLSEEDLSFVILKYQENYSDDYLATYFNLTIDEIKKKEIEILSLLRNNDKIKNLMKTRNN